MPGAPHPHRARCSRCRAFAEALEAAAASRRRVPLPVGLADRLRAIPEAAVEAAPRLPAVPLPPSLARRLRELGSDPTPLAAPPVWVRRARYAVAASVLLVLVGGAAFGSPVDLGRRTANAVRHDLRPPVATAVDQGRDRLRRLRHLAEDSWREATHSIAVATGGARSRLGGLVGAASRFLSPWTGAPEAEPPARPEETS